MLSSTTILRAAAMFCGVALIVSQIIQNVEHLGFENALSGLGLAAVAVPLAMAIAVPVMERCWSEGRLAAAAMTGVVILFGLSHTFIVALERGAHHREVAAAAKSNHGYDLAVKALDDAKARVKALEAESIVAAKGGCKSTCKATKQLLAEAQADAKTAQTTLAAIAPVEQDAMGKRYGVVAKLIDLWHPVVLPIAVELGALVLIGFAAHNSRPKPMPVAHVEPHEVAVQVATKVDEAVAAIERLRQKGHKLGTVREVAAQIGHSTMTTHRALRRVA